jgi:hypothetical protein
MIMSPVRLGAYAARKDGPPGQAQRCSMTTAGTHHALSLPAATYTPISACFHDREGLLLLSRQKCFGIILDQ